jgi:hypothetical protein
MILDPDQEGFVHSPLFDPAVLRDLFQANVLAFLLKERLISSELVERMKEWRHSGFHAYAGDDQYRTRNRSLRPRILPPGTSGFLQNGIGGYRRWKGGQGQWPREGFSYLLWWRYFSWVLQTRI